MLGGLEADLQFLRLGIEQEKTHLCVVRFSELPGTFLLKGGSAQDSSCLCICHLAYILEKTIYGKKNMADQQSLDRVLSCMSACKIFFIV